MKNIFILVAFCFPLLAFPAIVGWAKVEGIIVSYDKHTVTLSQRGRKTKVPRKSIPHFFKIKTGNKVYALIEGSDIMKQLQQKQLQQKQQKKTNKTRNLSKKTHKK